MTVSSQVALTQTAGANLSKVKTAAVTQQWEQFWLLQVNIKVECSIVKDSLKGQDSTELYLKLLSQEAESYPFKDDD